MFVLVLLLVVVWMVVASGLSLQVVYVVLRVLLRSGWCRPGFSWWTERGKVDDKLLSE